MTKRVLDIGNCRPDHAAIRAMIEQNFDARVVQAHTKEESIAQLQAGQYDLVLVNRKLDHDYSDGIEIIRELKSSPELAEIPVMMVTNYSDHQRSAIQAGAVEGFGKASLHDPATVERLKPYLTNYETIG